MKAAPFTWVVSFTVAPLWIQDGFTISNERAAGMLDQALGGCASADEYSAKVLEAPSAAAIMSMQGYGPTDPRRAKVGAEIIAGMGDAGVIRMALRKARKLIDSVAYVAKEGDKAVPLQFIDEALALIDARQGEPVEVEA